MWKLLRLWWWLYRARRLKSNRPIIARPATAEEVAKLEDNGRLVEAFWRLKCRSSRARVRVYRVIEKDEYGLCRVTIFENVERRVFVAAGYSSGWDDVPPELRRLFDISDSYNIVNHLWHPVLVERERWDSEGTDTIDAAADKARIKRQELFARVRSFGHAGPAAAREEIDDAPSNEAEALDAEGEDADGEDTDGEDAEAEDADAGDVQANEAEEYEMVYRDHLRQALDRLKTIAGTTDICWKPLGPTPAGRQCQIFVMKGKEEHWAPLRLLNLWPGRGRPVRVSDRHRSVGKG